MFPDSKNGSVTCAWCQRPGKKLYSLKTSSGVKAFCSEICFTQCRRASFKQSKICDWCKHVRHTVNYVDFEDGEHQLQFCSDKCLNQYKMNIFCKEAEEHLHLRPDLKSATVSPLDCKESEAKKLITPELWLKNLKNAAEDEPISTRNGLHERLEGVVPKKKRKKKELSRKLSSGKHQTPPSCSPKPTSKDLAPLVINISSDDVTIKPKEECLPLRPLATPPGNLANKQFHDIPIVPRIMSPLHRPLVNTQMHPFFHGMPGHPVDHRFCRLPMAPACHPVFSPPNMPLPAGIRQGFPPVGAMIVPYPVIIPLPIPIPIPLPLQNSDVAKIFKDCKLKHQSSSSESTEEAKKTQDKDLVLLDDETGRKVDEEAAKSQPKRNLIRIKRLQRSRRYRSKLVKCTIKRESTS